MMVMCDAGVSKFAPYAVWNAPVSTIITIEPICFHKLTASEMT